MGRNITLFSGYDQAENRTTNYCLLVLKTIYEENPILLSNILSELLGEEFSDLIGVQFSQQERIENSVLDGVIRQKAFSLYIETKNFDWFYDEQLANHLKALNGESTGVKILIALSNFESSNTEKFNAIEQLCKEQYKGLIYFFRIDMEDFVSVLETVNLPKNLNDLVSDLKVYFGEADLLPKWKNQLDVVGCSQNYDEIIKNEVFICPATNGQYNHARSKYIGFYTVKIVRKIAMIDAVVDIEEDRTAIIKWRNNELSEEEIRKKAFAKLDELKPGYYPIRIFCLGELFDTNFEKDSKGGMIGHKQYFDITSLAANDAQDLAIKLAGKKWSAFQPQ